MQLACLLRDETGHTARESLTLEDVSLQARQLPCRYTAQKGDGDLERAEYSDDD
jgi:hypothetical protein